MTALWVIVLCGALSIVYAAWATSSVLAADAGNARMQEIAAAVREGAQAYLRRQYMTIGLVGIVIFALLAYFLGVLVAIGFAIGAILSGAAGFIGMNVSVRANVRSPAFWWPVWRCSASRCTSPISHMARVMPPTAAPWLMPWWRSASAPR